MASTTRPPAPHQARAPLLKRLDARREEVLRFTPDFSVPFVTTITDATRRSVRLRHKRSGCLRTTAGASVSAVLRRLTDGHPWTSNPLTS